MQASELRPGQLEQIKRALDKARNALEKGIEVRMMDQWPVLTLIVPDAIREVKAALEIVTGWDDELESSEWAGKLDDNPTIVDEPLQLREGAWYVSRDGSYTTQVTKAHDDGFYAWRGASYWYSNGGRISLDNEHDFDLIAEVPPPVEPAIDVGEGWRLLGKDEPVEEGDEYLDTDGVWYRSVHFHHASRTQADFPYRRKIKAQEPPVEPERKHNPFPQQGDHYDYADWKPNEPEQFKPGDLVVVVSHSVFRGKTGIVTEIVCGKHDTLPVHIEFADESNWFGLNEIRRATPDEVAAHKQAQEPQPDADGWIVHDGTGCPVGGQCWIQTKAKDDNTGQVVESLTPRPAFRVTWENEKRGPYRLTHYRLVPSPQPAPITDWVEVVTR